MKGLCQERHFKEYSLGTIMEKSMSLTLLKDLFKGYDAYLVGGAARVLLQNFEMTGELKETNGTIKDWDVLVNHQVPPHLSGKWEWNSFRGIKYLDYNLDVWQDDIGRFLRQVPRAKDGIAIHLETEAILHTREFYSNPEIDITTRLVRIRTNKGII